MSKYRLKTGPFTEYLEYEYKKIEDGFNETFLNEDGSLKTGKLGDAVVEKYKAIEDAVVDKYKKIEDAFIDRFLEKVEDDDENSDSDNSDNSKE